MRRLEAALVAGETDVGTLTEEQVRAIRRDPRSLSAVGLEYRLTETKVRAIKEKQIWSWIEGEVVPSRRSRRPRVLTNDEIRKVRADPRRLKEIGLEFGIGVNAVLNIKLGRTGASAGGETFYERKNSLILTQEEVRSIRADPRSSAEIAIESSLSLETVRGIKSGRSYKEIACEPTQEKRT